MSTRLKHALHKRLPGFLGGGLWLLSTTIQAQSSVQPITVRADSAEWKAGGAMVYNGNVSMKSGLLELQGGRVEIRRSGPESYMAWVQGAPAQMSQAATGDTPAVRASAERMFMDSNAGVVELEMRAQLVRGGETLSGETIRYDFLGRRIRAGGGSQGPVRIDIPTDSLRPLKERP